jgi:hypothetical protein
MGLGGGLAEAEDEPSDDAFDEAACAVERDAVPDEEEAVGERADEEADRCGSGDAVTECLQKCEGLYDTPSGHNC